MAEPSSGGRAPSPIGSISVVIPAYNEQATIETTVRDYYAAIVEPDERNELIVVDDCSTDPTPRLLQDLMRRHPRLRVVRNETNVGHGRSLQRGWNEARGDWIFMTDADYQHRPEDFERLRSPAERGRRLVCGVRLKRRDPLVRRMLGGTIRRGLRLVFGVKVHDANCPFKLVERQWLESLRRAIPPDSLAPSMMLAVVAKIADSSAVAEVCVEHLPRSDGRGHLIGPRLVLFCARGFLQLLRLRKRLRTHPPPAPTTTGGTL